MELSRITGRQTKPRQMNILLVGFCILGSIVKKTFSTPKMTELQHVCYAAKKNHLKMIMLNFYI